MNALRVFGWLFREGFAAVGQVVSARTCAAFGLCDTEGERVLADLEANTETLEPGQFCFCPSGRTYVGCPTHGNGRVRVAPPPARVPQAPEWVRDAVADQARLKWDAETADGLAAAAGRDAACEREHCLCKRAWRHGDFINRAEHESAAAEHLTPAEAANRRLAEIHPTLLDHPDAPAVTDPRGGGEPNTQ